MIYSILTLIRNILHINKKIRKRSLTKARTLAVYFFIVNTKGYQF